MSLSPEQMGDLYMARKQYVEASQTFWPPVRPESDQRRLSQQAGHFHSIQQEALTLAMRYYEKALKANPKYADAENNIGTIWYQRKKYGKAIKAYQKAIKIKRRYGRALQQSRLRVFRRQEYTKHRLPRSALRSRRIRRRFEH